MPNELIPTFGVIRLRLLLTNGYTDATQRLSQIFQHKEGKGIDFPKLSGKHKSVWSLLSGRPVIDIKR